MLKWISRLDTPHRLMYSGGVAALVWLMLWYGNRDAAVQFVGAWLGFAGTSLLLAWIALLIAHPRQIRRFYIIEDSSRTVIFLIILAATLACLFAIVELISNIPKPLPVLAIFCSWALVHTVFAIRYAHLYYGGSVSAPHKGLDFPGDEEPDYLDFAYFSFVIGMTSQVSDVQISSKTMRRLALLHGVLSFIFNAVIVALSINILSGELKP